MRKTGLILALLLCLSLLLTACGEKQTTIRGESQENSAATANAAKETLSCAQYADQVQAAVNCAAMTDVNEKYLEKTLLIPAADLSDWVFRRDGEGATPEMILVLQVKEAGNVDNVKKAVQDYLDERILQYRDYQPDQLEKLENAKVLVRGDLVALCVTPDAEKAVSALGEGWK